MFDKGHVTFTVCNDSCTRLVNPYIKHGGGSLKFDGVGLSQYMGEAWGLKMLSKIPVMEFI